jgi:mono/diheme cytochrome c family protein
MTDDDYNVCPATTDGKHKPKPADVHDRDMPPGYFTVECAACHQTTGYPFALASEDIEWN